MRNAPFSSSRVEISSTNFERSCFFSSSAMFQCNWAPQLPTLSMYKHSVQRKSLETGTLSFHGLGFVTDYSWDLDVWLKTWKIDWMYPNFNKVTGSSVCSLNFFAIFFCDSTPRCPIFESP